MSNFVFVLDTTKRSLNPVHPGTARHLLKQGKAAVFRRYPFTLILKDACPEVPVQAVELRLEPGSQVTGIAIVQADKVLFSAELTHRGRQIQRALLSRRQLRKKRRSRKTRYRKSRFLNRTLPEGWLAPSLQHRVQTTMTWVNRLCKFAPVGSIVQELAKFDLQLIQNSVSQPSDLGKVEEQQNGLQAYEVKAYLTEKFHHQCVYCNAKDVPLAIAHSNLSSCRGSGRVPDLVLICQSCQQAQGNQTMQDFLSGQPNLLKRVVAKLEMPLNGASVVSPTQWALLKALKQTGLPIHTGSRGKTNFNRARLGLPQKPWLGAACVGEVDTLKILTQQPLLITAKGHGTRQMCGTNKYGFPIRHRSRVQVHRGFQTGDIVTAMVTAGQKVGFYVGRVLCRASGSFDMTTKAGRVSGINHKYCQVIHKKDGYRYSF
ncbi:MAG: RNA-guided endonuclease IscB [Oculatellaceae cyanobacterium Prado106]|jgi:5-methylcytosine-specific restriction endonuclease McrA|nr:RNA-guided endonuclease IscB [Oculatellaceae cyanobacterium Prado106]